MVSFAAFITYALKAIDCSTCISDAKSRIKSWTKSFPRYPRLLNRLNFCHSNIRWGDWLKQTTKAFFPLLRCTYATTLARCSRRNTSRSIRQSKNQGHYFDPTNDVLCLENMEVFFKYTNLEVNGRLCRLQVWKQAHSNSLGARSTAKSNHGRYKFGYASGFKPSCLRY